MSAAARLPDLRRSRSYLLRTARFLCCVHGAIVDQASDAPKRFDPLAAPLGDLSSLRSPGGSSRRLADAADRDRGRLSWRMADIRKPALPNGRSATLTPRAQKGLSERECVDRVVGGDIKPVFGGDERLKMVQTGHCLRRSCKRLATIGSERGEPVVALGAHDQYDRIRAAVGCCYDRRACVGDGTAPGGLDHRRGVEANFQRNQIVRRLTSRTMRAIALQNDKYPVGGAPNRWRREGVECRIPLRLALAE